MSSPDPQKPAEKVAFLDLRRQTAELEPDLQAAMQRVLQAGRFVGGEELERFERSFADFCGAAHAVGVGSGTDAITLALMAAGVGPGDEVITSAATCVPTVAAIENAGALPVLADIETPGETLDPGRVAEAITPRTRAIVPVHLYGQCADMAPLLSLARDHDLVVIEDAAQAHGAEYEGRRAGSLGDAGAFSFYPTKNLGALGDGGAVVTNDSAIADRVRALRNYGFRDVHVADGGGRNSRLDPLQAAVLGVKLERLDGWVRSRRALADRYREALGGMPGVMLPTELPGRRHPFHLFVVRLDHRDAVRARLAQMGVQTLVHYEILPHEQPAYSELSRGSLTASEGLARQALSLPLYPELPESEFDRVVDAVRVAIES